MSEGKPTVSYLRVSTQGQGRSGLGIEAQREAIARFASAHGFEVAGEFVELESGKGADALELRPQLRQALGEAKRAQMCCCRSEAGPIVARRRFYRRSDGAEGRVHRR